jgi:protein O-GlcNAc transferase
MVDTIEDGLGASGAEETSPAEPLGDDEIAAKLEEARAEGAEGLAALGVLLRALGRPDVAERCYLEAMNRAPAMTSLRAGLAAALTDLASRAEADGDGEEKLRLYERALAMQPNNAEALYNLGVVWMDEGCLERAAFMFEMAFQVDPGRAEAMNNLGIIHEDLSGPARAAECYLTALRARPGFPQALNNLALVYLTLGRARDAELLLETALAHDPAYARAHNNLGTLQMELGVVPLAVESFVRCLALSPDDRNAGHNLLLALNYVTPGDHPEVSAAHRRWGEEFSARNPPLPPLPPDDLERRCSEDRPPVVGYLSPDLCTHSVSYFVDAPLRHHDPTRAQVIVYSCVSHRDETTSRLRQAVETRGHVWHDVGHLSEDVLARMIRDDEVDILVDLAGHTSENRLGCMAMRPAPVQATWIGYPGSTGLSQVDYRFTDPVCDPPSSGQTSSEELVRLPGCYACYTPPPDPPGVAPLPALDSGFVTFGSFSNLAKLTPEVLGVWARLLAAVPGSRLLVKRKPLGCAHARRRLLDRMESAGIDPRRASLAAPTPTHRDHLSSYAQIDVSLDPWPYTGVTTTCESLLMGVPVVTLRGRGHAHNASHSLLSAAGLADAWSARDQDEYVAIAARAAADVQGLAALRAGLRERLLASPLCDGPRFVRGLEDVYADLFRRWREHARAPRR